MKSHRVPQGGATEGPYSGSLVNQSAQSATVRANKWLTGISASQPGLGLLSLSLAHPPSLSLALASAYISFSFA